MTERNINRIGAIVPIVMSLLALVTVLLAVATGWGMVPDDEGAAAHVFQILIVLQMPFILAFLVTADWSKWRLVTGLMVLQAAAIVVAFSPVVYFKL